jgi:hypothetical protein
MTTHEQHTDVTPGERSEQPVSKPAGQPTEKPIEQPTEQRDQSTERVEPSSERPAHTAEQLEPTAEPTAGTADSTAAAPATSTGQDLFADNELAGLRARWDNVQAGFVDDPRECVKQADGLVTVVVEQLTVGFTQARSRLEEQWDRGEEASTEDLRVALKRYRDFFERLLAV